MKIVLDTNVLVSGLLKPSSVPGRIYEFLIEGRFGVLVTPQILAEYETVLARPKFHFSQKQQIAVLEYLRFETEFIQDLPLRRTLPDPDDLAFLAAAYHGKADVLVTGNLKDFPKHLCKPVAVLNPSEFLNMF